MYVNVHIQHCKVDQVPLRRRDVVSRNADAGAFSFR